MIKAASSFKNDITISLLSCIAVLATLYLYSRSTSPYYGDVFISPSLYDFAIVVLISFFICISLLVLKFLSALFSKRTDEKNNLKLSSYLKTPFRERKFILVFGLSSIVYFTFFSLLTNMFILFDDQGNVFSLIPTSLGLGLTDHDSIDHSSSNHQSDNLDSIEALQNEDSDLHAAHPQHQTLVIEDMGNESVASVEPNQMSYPSYRIIICCNNFGYVPMLTLYINSNFSFLLIPLNFFLGIIISLLVGLNISLSLFVINRLRMNIKSLSKGNIFGSLGLSTGLLIGCPTCAGSLLYSILGFSSLIAISSLSLYQMFFVVISIPFLIISLFMMTKLLRTSTCDLRN